MGLWLIFSPTVFGTQGRAADSDHLTGALVVTIAVIAMAEVVRAGRFLNILPALWILAAPWLLAGATDGAKWNGMIVGVILILAAFPRGAVRERYGSWNQYII